MTTRAKPVKIHVSKKQALSEDQADCACLRPGTKGMAKVLRVRKKGGKGSGNFNHLGRPDKVGGSAPSGTSPKSDKILNQALEDWFEYDNAAAMAQSSAGESLDSFYTQGGERLGPSDVARLTEQSKVLQEAASSSNSGERALYRGIAMESTQAVKTSFPVGKTISLKKLSAASTDPKIASIYNDPQMIGLEEGQGVRVMLELENPKGVTGLRRNDEEVVLPAGATYRVTRSWKTSDGVIHITLWEKVHKASNKAIKVSYKGGKGSGFHGHVGIQGHLGGGAHVGQGGAPVQTYKPDWRDNLGFAREDKNNPGQQYVLTAHRWVMTIGKLNVTGASAIKSYKAGKITEGQLHRLLAPAYDDWENGYAEAKWGDDFDAVYMNPDRSTVSRAEAKQYYRDMFGDYITGTANKDRINEMGPESKWLGQARPSKFGDPEWQAVVEYHMGLETLDGLQSRIAPETLPQPKATKVPKAAAAVLSDEPIHVANYSKPEDLPSYAGLMDGSITDYGGHNGGHNILDQIAKDQGFDGLPHNISRAEFDKYVKAGEVAIYRGTTTSSDDKKRAARYREFRTGKYYSGDGVHGYGTYASTVMETAASYDSRKNVLGMTIKKGARIITEDAAISGMNSWYDPNPAHRYSNTIKDNIGYWAAAAGYDAIRCPDEDYNGGDFYVILNRTAVRVCTTDFTQKDDPNHTW